MSVDDRFQSQFAELQRRRLELRDEPGTLREAGGGGTSGGVTDDWKASVDAQLKRLDDAINRVTSWIIVGVAGPLLAIIGLYAYVGLQIGAVNTRIDGVNGRIDAVNTRIESVRVDQARLQTKIDLLLERSAPARRAE